MDPESNIGIYRDSFLKILAEVKDTFYKPDEVSDIIKFIEEYTPENDFYKICYKWEGGYGADFIDSNQASERRYRYIYVLITKLKYLHCS